MRRALLSSLVASLILCDVSSTLRAQTLSEPAVRPGQRVHLQLANGDRLSGELIWRADGKLRFRSPVLGDLTLKETDVAILDIPESLDPRMASHESTVIVPGKPAAIESTSAAPATDPSDPTGGSATLGTKQTPKPQTTAAPTAERWKGKVELGSVQQTGRTDTLSYHARVEAEKKVRRHTLRANGRVLYAEQNDQPSTDRQDAAFRWRYQLSKRTFAQSQTSYYRDDIIQIQTNLEHNAGLGYLILDLPRHTVNGGGGLTAQYREWDAGTNGWALYGEVFQDYTFKINDRITFQQEAVAQYSPSDRAFNIPNPNSPATVDPEEQNYKLRLNSTLQGKVTERISVNLRFEYELDNAIQLEDARQTQRITSSIGYAF
jgi:putative salt-induced outer membrane protein YdiY